MFCGKTSEAILQNIILKRDLIRFLNQNNFFLTITQYIDKFVNLCQDKQKYTTFVIPVEIDFHSASDFSRNISVALIESPFKFNFEVQQIIHHLLGVILETKDIQLSQIFINIIPKSVPLENEIHLKGLYSFQAILIEHTEQKKYICSTSWMCVNHNTPIFEKGLPTSVLRCDLCDGILQEMVSFRTMGDMVTGIFINANCLKMNKAGKRYQAIQVELKDSNICEIELGAVYNITGVQLTNFVAWHCEKSIHRPILLKDNDIFKIFSQYREKSPWMFVYALSMQFASHIYPHLAYINLKIGILLSLTSLNEKSNAVPIFAYGNDSLTAHHLFLSASDYAERFVCSSVNQNLSAQKRNGSYEANPLVLSRGGVCYLGDWEKYQKEKNAFIIRSALESNIINFEDFTLPLRSTVWTYWEKPTKAKNLTQLQTLINVFGIPFLCDPCENEEEVIDFLLNQNALKNNCQQTYKINDIQMRQFLQSVSCKHVTVSETAQKLLSDYFVASRRLRPGCLPIRALEHMTSFAEAHARLNLRPEVICEDVIVVVSLYEASMEIIFGCCKTLPSYRINIKAIEEVDAEMKKFTFWFNEFLSIE